ncbi:MAG: lyase family protein [Acidimicrobiales bacterium]
MSPDDETLGGGGLFVSLFTSDDVARETSDAAWLQAMLDAESALAGAEAGCGVIEAESAEAIALACEAAGLDAVGIGRASRLSGNPVIPLLAALRARLDPETAARLHHGATSQDILDTALMLVSSRSMGFVARDLERAAAAAGSLAVQHRETLEVARTLLQPALPTTFGLRAAGWGNALLTALERLELLRSCLPAQLGGAAGTLDMLGEAGQDVRQAFAAALGLAPHPLSWHSDRQPVAELGSALALACGVSGKIGRDVSLLSMGELAEVHEPFEPGRGASSAMPHKRNPALSSLLMANARRAPNLAATLTSCLDVELDRSPGTWQAEWLTITELLRAAGGSASIAAELLEGLEVDARTMAGHVEVLGELVLDEQTDPRTYLGSAGAFVDAVTARLLERKAGAP